MGYLKAELILRSSRLDLELVAVSEKVLVSLQAKASEFSGLS